MVDLKITNNPFRILKEKRDFFFKKTLLIPNLLYLKGYSIVNSWTCRNTEKITCDILFWWKRTLGRQEVCLSVLPSLAGGYHSNSQDSCWCSSHYISVPSRKKEKAKDKNCHPIQLSYPSLKKWQEDSPKQFCLHLIYWPSKLYGKLGDAVFLAGHISDPKKIRVQLLRKRRMDTGWTTSSF